MRHLLDENEVSILRRAISVLLRGVETGSQQTLLLAGFRAMGNAALNGQHEEWADAAHLISDVMLHAAKVADEVAASTYMGEGI